MARRGDSLPSTQSPDATTVAPEGPAVPAVESTEVYVDRGELGRGGTARVARVYDPRLCREVAMKVLDERHRDHAGARAGLVAEARVTGRLDHPYIVPVYAIGVTPERLPFFTMKIVSGLTLRRWLRTSASRPNADRLSDALEIFLKVCDAVAFAHDRGVLHRDIKPDNVMVGDYGEVYLMDWGLATASRSGATGAAGTPAYMPPEQANGWPTDPRSDIFALGGLLYFILSGRAPYTGGGTADVLRQARAGEWTDLAQLADIPPVPAGLLPIVRRAMARHPDTRFESAQDLAQAVRGFLRQGLHLPERVFPPGAVIIHEGEPGSEGYIIRRGRVRASRDVDGAQVVLREMGPGEAFGELAILSERPRTATVEALEEVVVLVVTRAVLEGELGLNTWVGAFVRSLASRFSELEEQLMTSRR